MYFDDMPFYIGMTNKPLVRYKFHYVDICSPINKLLRHYAMNRNKYPVMKLVYCNENKGKVETMETFAIKTVSSLGFPLLNIRDNNNYNEHKKLYPDCPIIERFKSKTFTHSIIQPIINNIKEILKEYGYETHRHYDLDYSKSISRPVRSKYTKRSQLDKKK